MMLKIKINWFFIASVFLLSCNTKQPLFKKLSAEKTGINFVNKIKDTDSLNILDYLYFYNGGGVAVGDVNNDGWEDIFFTSNKKGGNKLYLNKGNWKFDDITLTAGIIQISDWTTGVTMADVNGDGFLDIYICAVAGKLNLKGKNQLYINKGDGTFVEEAAKYGLDFSGYSTQAVFFDYDKDGDLDCYLLNQSDHSTNIIRDTSNRKINDPLAGDKLFRNDKNGVFNDVTNTAGIYSSGLGYGLGIAIGDINNDGWDDIYIGNDFHENDYCYINNKNGTFTESSKNLFGHYSRFSMGNDLADINNDGSLDLITVDMLPGDEKILKTYGGDDPADIYAYKITGNGFQNQFSRNMLQLNDGTGHFSEVGLMYGVSATDWSWSPLFADFDLDGVKDLLISNGIVRRPSDMDYIKFISNREIQIAINQTKKFDSQILEKMPGGATHNYLFKGTDSGNFIDESINWGMDKPTLSNGAAYADLDNDGDLDIITNDINAEAGIYMNTIQDAKPLSIRLKGNKKNRFGIGAKVYAFTNGKTQFLQQSLTRGFQSSSSPVLHFGFDTLNYIDSLLVIWPDLLAQKLYKIPTANTITLIQSEAKDTFNTEILFPPVEPFFKDITESIGINWKHKENNFVDFNQQSLIPHQLSTLGPKISVADVNGDGLDDFFVCGAAGQPGKLFLQNAQSQFTSSDDNVFKMIAASEEVDALFVDVNNDHHPDLYVVSGGNQYANGSPELEDHLFINDGLGHFTLSNNLPQLYFNKNCVSAADIDGDGDMDLFIGARAEAGDYGKVPDSYLMQNDGKGKFSVVTDKLAKGLKEAGMISAATFADVNGDDKPDLLVIGEWMPLKVFINKGGFFEESLSSTTSQMSGWWQTLCATDIDGDGDIDVLAGNYGLNSKLKATVQYPLLLYLVNFDERIKKEQILCSAKDGKYYTFLGKDELEKEIPSLKKKFLEFNSFAGKDINEVFGNTLDQIKPLSASTLTSSIFINDGAGNFTIKSLPPAAQFSPVFSIIPIEQNSRNLRDIFCGGNFMGVLPYEGIYDGNHGCLLQQTSKDDFLEVTAKNSGLHILGEVRDIKKLKLAKGQVIFLVARNNDSVLFYSFNN